MTTEDTAQEFDGQQADETQELDGQDGRKEQPEEQPEVDEITRKALAKLRRESASYRTKLREAEEALEAERAKVTALQVAAVRKASGLPNPEILARSGIELTAFVDVATGAVDQGALDSAILELRRSLGVDVPPARPGPGGGGLEPFRSDGSTGNPIADALRSGPRR